MSRRLLAGLLALGIALPAATATPPAFVPPAWTPAPGDFIWSPDLAPAGPVVIVVSLPLQQLHVYRNAVRIGASTISSGRDGHETPPGAFRILEKKVEHYSNLYDNAPMPYMQRLTWDGVAIHAGRLPGYPASHGCIRVPERFAKVLFDATRRGDLVIVTPLAGPPGLVMTADLLPAVTASPGAAPGDDAGTWWAPGEATGPVTVVLSTRDRRVTVLGGGVPIGGAPLDVEPGLRFGTRAYVLLEGAGSGPDPVLPGRTARRWMRIAVDTPRGDGTDIRAALATGRLSIPADFAARVDAVLEPGATVVLTDEPLGTGDEGRSLQLETSDPQ